MAAVKLCSTLTLPGGWLATVRASGMMEIFVCAQRIADTEHLSPQHRLK